ncbi:histidine phosphatase family protein [Pelagibaculum spongiae]|uniref:Histidine phosphatase family protein n=1 Tax=Pelagibaculum spongiae TaxID=2080658 RepID=A0A2V1GYX0_9GAMM|nr:histidine phosphatase family protein [Pelagibaculum spongiae]PVZ71956.1 histidine phosphatase family protein [Pelagibaculum spongiae]
MLTTIDLLRHGLPEGGRKLRGAIDDPLSKVGWQQMWSTVDQYLENPPWQHIVCSPLIRCSQFAEKLADKANLSYQIIPELKEISFGVWDGKSPEEIGEKRLAEYWLDPLRYAPDQSEGIVEFNQRILNVWANLLNNYNGQHILLVGHGALIRILLANVLQMPLHAIYRIEVPFASLSRILIQDKGEKPFSRLAFHASR